jgi:hypothetical protein
MNTSQNGAMEAVAAAIVDYLRAHPMAADSAAGVRRWWIGAQRAGPGLDEVESALDLLVERRVLRRLPLGDGTMPYAPVVPPHQ